VDIELLHTNYRRLKSRESISGSWSLNWSSWPDISPVRDQMGRQSQSESKYKVGFGLAKCPWFWSRIPSHLSDLEINIPAHLRTIRPIRHLYLFQFLWLRATSPAGHFDRSRIVILNLRTQLKLI
jgi:hypothetical protein